MGAIIMVALTSSRKQVNFIAFFRRNNHTILCYNINTQSVQQIQENFPSNVVYSHQKNVVQSFNV